jgi:thiol:disulfide interchange protein DsbD
MSRLALAAVLLAAAPAPAQFPFDDPPRSKLPKGFAALADVRVGMPAKVRRGETVTIKLTVDLKPGKDAHTYPFFTTAPGQDPKNKIDLPPGDLALLDGNTDPPGLEMKPGEPDLVYNSSPTWELKALVLPTAAPGPKDLGLGKTRIQVCADQCVTATGDELPRLVFTVTDEPPLADAPPPPPRKSEPVKPGTQGGTVVVAPTVGPKIAKPLDVYEADLTAVAAARVPDESAAGAAGTAPADAGLAAFALTAAAWGLISLVTPCVFPMIPITVSIFLKHAHGSFRERVKLAGVYSLTIIVVLGVSAFALLKFMAWLSAHPATNLALGLLFLVLALSLFGMYELTLPSFLSRRLQAKQAKGGTLGTVFGALAFTVISFTCVAPFLGGFAGISAADSGGGSLISLPTTRELVGGLAFATAFAAPFFVLAMVPGLLKALPKSGGWLDSVKVVMAFLELAAALKFFRTAELRVFSPTEFFTYDAVIAGWVGIAFACGLYLLNAYRLPHDEEKPTVGVPRLLFALFFVGLGFYLLPAMWKGADGKAQRPAGAVYAWVQAFLLPETEPWPTDLKDAVDRARQSKKPVLVDFTGVTCTNCKYNEESVFPLPAVRAEFEKFERVQLYTDEVPPGAYASDPGEDARVEEAQANRRFQNAVFKDVALPLYAVLVPLPDGKVKVVGGPFKGQDNVPFEGKINDPGAFAKWLQGALARAKK